MLTPSDYNLLYNYFELIILLITIDRRLRANKTRILVSFFSTGIQGKSGYEVEDSCNIKIEIMDR